MIKNIEKMIPSQRNEFLHVLRSPTEPEADSDDSGIANEFILI